MKRVLFVFILLGVLLGGFSCRSSQEEAGMPAPAGVETPREGMADTKFPPEWLDEIGFKVAWKMDFHTKLVNMFYIWSRDRLHGLYVETEDHRLYKMNPKNGEVLWVVVLKEAISQSPYLYLYEGVRSIAEEEEELNRYEITQMDLIIKRILAMGKLTPELYLITANKLVCIDDEHGRLLWEKHLPFGVSSPPIASYSYAYVADWRRRLFALRKDNRTIDWDFAADGDLTAGGFSYDPGLFFADERGYVYCLNAATGKEIWRSKTLDRITSPPFFYQSRLFVGSWDGSVYALRDNDGSVLWRFDCEYPVVDQPVAIDDPDKKVATVYAVTSKTVRKIFYAIDRTTGKERWRLRHGMRFLLQGRHNAYILDIKGRICAVDLLKGIVRWQRPFNMVNFFVVNPSDRRAIKKEFGFYHIYCGFRNGLVYALEEREMY
ncbi:MAG: PQQ-binding-like beta-propeller repeat protein [Planctomycetota bacterium]|nr:PQQ-binding-like beta-propeller repeat protein [Planctomycetota bacterium]